MSNFSRIFWEYKTPLNRMDTTHPTIFRANVINHIPNLFPGGHRCEYCIIKALSAANLERQTRGRTQQRLLRIAWSMNGWLSARSQIGFISIDYLRRVPSSCTAPYIIVWPMLIHIRFSSHRRAHLLHKSHYPLRGSQTVQQHSL